MAQQIVRSSRFTLIFNDLLLRFLFCSTNVSSRVGRTSPRYDWLEFLRKEATEPVHADPMLSASFTDSPPVTDATPAQPPANAVVEEVSTNPQVAALQVIFPDFEPIILWAELVSFLCRPRS